MLIRRAARVFLFALALLVCASTAAAAYYIDNNRPIILAYIFPILSGFSDVGENIYVYGASPEKITSIKTMAYNAEERGRLFYGAAYYRGRLLICTTQDCDQKFEQSSRAKGETYLVRFSFISSAGIDVVTFAHEISHMTFAHLVGAAASAKDVVPTWFDEGLATIVSRDERRVSIDAEGNMHCVIDIDSPLPGTSEEWSASDRGGPVIRDRLYAASACRVLRWSNSHGGSEAVVAAAQAIREGKASPFL